MPESREQKDCDRMQDFGGATLEEDHSIPGVFAVRVRGPGGDAEAAFRRWRHILTRAGEVGSNKLLVFRDMHGALVSEQELPALMQRLGEYDMASLRIAMVQPHHDRYRIDELGSLLAMEQGADARVFPDEASALVWLRYGND
jgi:hypothetical protein